MTHEEVLALIAQAKREAWTELDLSGLYLTELPLALDTLDQLQVLKLGRRVVLEDKYILLARYNCLSELPEWMAQLTNLQSLDLSGNSLSELPEWMADTDALPQLMTLSIGKNPIAEPPAEVLGDALEENSHADIDAIRGYFRQVREEGQTYFYEAKLLIIGEGGAGKTSLARKLVDPTSPPLPARPAPRASISLSGASSRRQARSTAIVTWPTSGTSAARRSTSPPVSFSGPNARSTCWWPTRATSTPTSMTMCLFTAF